MRTFQLEQVNKEITSHAGHALVGAAITNRTNLAQAIDAALPKRHGTPSSDVVKAYLGILTQGKNDFESINALRHDAFFHQAFDFQKPLPTEACIRLRLEKEAKPLDPIINQSNIDFLKNTQAPITALATGHIPLDIDVTPHDNSNTQKEQVSRTYKGMDGYAPIACYLGQEGWGIRYELRPGKQHSQCEFIPVLERTFDAVHQVLKSPTQAAQMILVRLDSAHDAKETRGFLQGLESPHTVDYIIKWNPRTEASEANKDKWLQYALQRGPLTNWETPREGKRVATFNLYMEEQHDGKTYKIRRVIQITERTIDKHGQRLLAPELTLEGWWTTLNTDYCDQQILALYRDHATSEQFHSEIKTDLDLERLPSGKFDSNTLILTLGLFTYNILKWIGLVGLMGKDSPVRHKAKRRRVRTVIQTLVCMAAHIYERGHRLVIRFGRTATGYQAFQRVYQQLCYG
jgi:hypothetical protein